MKHWISTTIFAVLVNGTLEGFFNSSRGLRQGDPVSPFLFVLSMDVLNIMLKVAVDESFLFGFSMGGASFGSVIVSHLFFTDDALIFCEPDPNHIRSLRALLLCFKVVSNIKVNLSKSEFVRKLGRLYGL